MTSILSDTILKSLSKSTDLTSDETVKIKYVLNVIIGDVSKLIIIVLAFWLFNYHLLVIYGMFTLWCIRTFTGGLHFNNYLSCLMFSIVFFASSVFLYFNIMLTKPLLIILVLLNLLVIMLLSPMKSASRPEISKKKKTHFKIIACLVVLITFVGVILTKNHPYFVISIWVITLQSHQLLLRKGQLFYEKTKTK